MKDLRQQGTKAFLWDFSGKLLTQGSSFIVTIFLARLLEPSDFGLIAMAMVVIGLASIFSDVGLGGALIQRRRLHPVHYSSVFYFNVTIGLVLSLVTYFSAGFVADFYDEEKLVNLVETLSVLFVLSSVNAVHLVKFRKELQYKFITTITLTASIVSGILGVTLAFYDYGVYALVYQQLTSAMLSVILVWRFSSWRPTLEFSLKALYQLWVFGFRMFLSGFLDSVFSRIDYLVIGKLFDAGTLGLFERAKSLNQLVVANSSGSLMNVLFPVLSKIQNNLVRFQRVVLKGYGALSFIVFMLIGFLYIGAHEIILLVFGQKWEASVNYFEILALSAFAYPLSSLLVNVLSARGNSKAFFRLEIIKKIAFGINLYVGFIFGIEGYLYGLIIASIWGVGWNIYYAKKEIHLEFKQFVYPPAVQAFFSAISAVIVMNIERFVDFTLFVNLMFESSLFFVIYVGINMVFKTSSWVYTLEEAVPVFDKIKVKLKGNQ